MEDKVFFLPGELVTLRQDLPNKPVMIVMKKETCPLKVKSPLSGDKQKVEYFRGIKCRWFTSNMELQEAI